MEADITELEKKGRLAKAASKKLALLPTDIKNKALIKISVGLITRQEEILSANKSDYEEAESSGMSTAMLDRLMLSASRLQAMAQDIKNVASLPDPVGEVIEKKTLPNGLQLIKKRVPLGVIGAIY
jgi:glutamate-5-semialdehyde dehydrogenase